MRKIVCLVWVLLIASFPTFGQLSVWTKNKGINIGASSKSIPAFPKSIPEYKSTNGKNYWDDPVDLGNSIRLFQSEGWTEIPDFPYTMNHCSDGVFMIRWRSANPKVKVSTTVEYLKEYAKTGKTGSYGYMYGTNCTEPLFKFVSSTDGANLVDIYYEIKFWKAAP